jgi:hypothetical protein
MSKTLLEQRPVDRLEIERFFAAISQSKVGIFFSEMNRLLGRAENQQRRIDRKRATGFNVFHVIKPDENNLSDVLAWLLDPQESHGQGNVFLLLLFKRLGFDSQAKHTMKAKVRREALTFVIHRHRRRMDVLVEAGPWLLVIENKVDSPEQHEQVKDYLEYLHRRTHDRFIKSALIYLTPYGRKPDSLDKLALKQQGESVRLHCWNYCGNLRGWLDDCRDACEAKAIRFFLTNFLGYIETNLKRESENQHGEDEDDN